MKKSLIALFLTFVGLSAMAQSKFNVSGTILEDETNDVVISATVRILNLPDSSMVAGAATGFDGSFSIKNVKAGKYALKITYVGFQTKVMPLDLTNKKDKNVSVGYIHIVPDAKMIKDVTVTANVAPVQVSGDSIVYNADAYRVPEGSTLEALVKKLPGVQIDENGGITNDDYVTHPETFTDQYVSSEIPTNLTSNWNRNDGLHLFLTHRYNVGFYRKVPMTEQEIEAKKFAIASRKEAEEREKQNNGDVDKKGRPTETLGGRPADAKIEGDLPSDTTTVALNERISVCLCLGPVFACV